MFVCEREISYKCGWVGGWRYECLCVRERSHVSVGGLVGI